MLIKYMETTLKILDIIILFIVISTPIFMLFFLERNIKKKITVKYFFIGAFIMSILISISAVWSDFSNLILLKHYGYNVDYMNYENVLPENREHVKILVTSIMGIGWPLKAVFGFVLMIPYLIILYISKKMIDKMKKS